MAKRRVGTRMIRGGCFWNPETENTAKKVRPDESYTEGGEHLWTLMKVHTRTRGASEAETGW